MPCVASRFITRTEKEQKRQEPLDLLNQVHELQDCAMYHSPTHHNKESRSSLIEALDHMDLIQYSTDRHMSHIKNEMQWTQSTRSNTLQRATCSCEKGLNNPT